MSVQKRLIFSEGHFSRILDGAKKVTLRAYRAGSHDFVADETFYGEFLPEGVAFLLRATLDTQFVTAGNIPDDVAQEDGFESGADAFEKLKGFYPNLVRDSRIAVIRFEILAHDGSPIIKYLPGA